MSEQFLGEIRIMSFNFPPKGWAFCNGQLLPINQNQALFSLLGTMYGGNGQTTFALPNLQGRVPMHNDSGFIQGQTGGETAHTLTLPELAAHSHVMAASTNPPDRASLAGNYFDGFGANAYAPTANANMNPTNVSTVGGSQLHNNMSPYLVLSFCIALVGIFPSRN